MKRTTLKLRSGLVIAMMCALAACAVDPTVEIATSEQALICGENCDPGNFQYLVSQVVGEASGLGTQVSGSMQCRHYEARWPDDSTFDECSAIYQDPWGQQYLVDCSSIGACSHGACGWGTQPPCRF